MMAELRALLLPTTEPLRLRRGPGAFTDAALRPLARGLVFLAALSLPVLGCTFADRFHGGGSRFAHVDAAGPSPSQTRTTRAPSRQALLTPAKFAQSLSLQ